MRADLLGPFLRLGARVWGEAGIYLSLFCFVLKNLLPTAMVTIGFPITGDHGDSARSRRSVIPTRWRGVREEESRGKILPRPPFMKNQCK